MAHCSTFGLTGPIRLLDDLAVPTSSLPSAPPCPSPLPPPPCLHNPPPRPSSPPPRSPPRSPPLPSCADHCPVYAVASRSSASRSQSLPIHFPSTAPSPFSPLFPFTPSPSPRQGSSGRVRKAANGRPCSPPTPLPHRLSKGGAMWDLGLVWWGYVVHAGPLFAWAVAGWVPACVP